MCVATPEQQRPCCSLKRISGRSRQSKSQQRTARVLLMLGTLTWFLIELLGYGQLFGASQTQRGSSTVAR
jgi:hypothetical protein